MRFLALAFLLFATPAFGQADVVASCGSVTLKAGVPHNVTVDLNGQSCQASPGSMAAKAAPKPPDPKPEPKK
jgi:hypothetical protein